MGERTPLARQREARYALAMLLGQRPLTRVEKACLLSLVVVLTVAAWMGAMGCSVASPKYFQQPDFPVMFVSENQLARLSPGSARGDVWKVVGFRDRKPPNDEQGYRAPQPLLVAKSRVGDAWVEAYEIEGERTKGRTEKVWLYLCADRLIRWGSPYNWPTEAEVNYGLQQASEAKP